MSVSNNSMQELASIRAEIGRLRKKEKSLFASFLDTGAALARQSADELIERQLRGVFRHDKLDRKNAG